MVYMGNQRKHKSRTKRDEEGMDKPSYAADVLLSPKKPSKPVRKETDIFLEEHLGQNAVKRLEDMKQQLLTQEEEMARQTEIQKPGQPLPKQRKKSADEKILEDPNLSFAELFDPTDEEDQDFAELLNDSKLDWRYFKD